jgi:hypothetical protein
MKVLLKKILPVVFLAVLFSNCKKQLLDINTDPNNPTTASADPSLVLPAALNNTAAIYSNPTADARFAFAGLWLGHISYSGNYAIATENISYAITNNFAAAAFGNIYDNLEDYDFVEKKGAVLGNNFYRAIGILMKAYNYQTLVDLYNNVPYSEALQGTAASKPKYDDAKAIYDDLGKKMDTAIALFKVAVTGSISGDIMFGGDATKWLKFANTVKLRLLLRQSERTDRAAYIATEKTKLAGAAFLDVDATVNPGYLNSAGKANPFWGSNINTSGTYTQDFYRAGQYVIDFLTAHNDPRAGRFFKFASSPGGTYQGNYFGDQGIPNSKTSEFGPGVLKAFSQPASVMLAAESYFLQAEAAARGWITVSGFTPDSLYKKGVVASFIYFGANYPPIRNYTNTADSIVFTPTTSAYRYYSQPGDKQVNWAATAGLQEQIALIIRQKWVALTLTNELEAYNDYRRLGLPTGVPLSTSPFSTGKVPTRLLYPQREFEVNGDNVPAGITPTTKVWWMP